MATTKPNDTEGVNKYIATELKDFKTSAGTIQFTPDKPIPEELLQKILRYRVVGNLEKKK